MAKQDTTKVLWKVEARLSRKHAWRSKGIFETRWAARLKCRDIRGVWFTADRFLMLTHDEAVGFGNTRIVRHVRGQR